MHITNPTTVLLGVRQELVGFDRSLCSILSFRLENKPSSAPRTLQPICLASDPTAKSYTFRLLEERDVKFISTLAFYGFKAN